MTKRTRIFVAAMLVATTSSCNHNGLAPAMAGGSLAGCVEWAQKNNDTELEQLCRAGRPLTELLDLFAARQRQVAARDAGSE